MSTEKITIRGREYTVERVETKAYGVRYRLTGKRGASFFTMRNVNHPHAMFIVAHSIGNGTLDGVWLSDEDGSLRVVTS